MKQEFVKVAAATPDIRVADVPYNMKNLLRAIGKRQERAKNPGYFRSCASPDIHARDLFTGSTAAGRKAALLKISITADKDILVFVGLPSLCRRALQHVRQRWTEASAGADDQMFLPNYGEFYEMRQLLPDRITARDPVWRTSFLWPQILFRQQRWRNWSYRRDVRNVWSPFRQYAFTRLWREPWWSWTDPPAMRQSKDATAEKRTDPGAVSQADHPGYIYARKCRRESTDLVFGGHNLIAKGGAVLKEGKRYCNDIIIYSELDIHRLTGERRKNTTLRQPVSTALSGCRSIWIYESGSHGKGISRSSPLFLLLRRADKKGVSNSDDSVHGGWKRLQHIPMQNALSWNLQRAGFHACCL